jgi:hypothetical protein
MGKYFGYIVVGSLSFGLINACAHVGLSAIPQTREGYNKALSTSDNEQFLLNIVRMHYGQSPYFVNVDNMVTSTTLTATSGVDSQISNDQSIATTGNGIFWRASPAVTFTQTPTITYSPLQGTQFVSGMLTPIDMDKLSLLLQSGWSVSAVLKLTLDNIGGLTNITSVLHTSTVANKKQDEFNMFVNTLDEMDDDNKISVAASTYHDQRAAVINIADDETAAILCKMLHLSKPYRQLIFSRAVSVNESVPENIIRVQTRSFFGMLNFLSEGVVASDDEYNAESGITKTFESGALSHNWNTLTRNLFMVSVSDNEPSKTAAKVSFSGKWYYIANNDRVSKATLVLLRMVYSLQVGDFKANLPLITIPVK